MELKEINKKITSGILTLTFRRASLFALRFLTINLILARILDPSIIGIFNIANSILAFFTFFSDIGLAAAIIQKKEIQREDLKTTFTIQTLLALIILLLVWFISPYLSEIYQIGEEGMWLIRALGVGFFLTALKVLPSVLLERDLKFGPLVLVEILETLVFCVALIGLSFSGYGVNGFSISVILQSIAGVAAIYIIAPWKIGLGISKEAAKSLFKFGLPFQLNSILALLKDRLVPLVIAGMVGPLGVGYITWAQSLAFVPLEVMNIMIRVTFPAYSRVQHDQALLKETLEKSLSLTALFLYPLLFGLIAIAPSLVQYVVSDKWQPALPLIYLFALSTFWAPLSTTFTNVFNALGKVGITLKLMVMWTTLTWILSPILTIYYGFMGVAIASAIISFTSIIPIIIVKRVIDIKIFEKVWRPILSSAIMAIIVFLVSQILVRDILTLLVTIVFGGVVYFGLMSLIAREDLKTQLRVFSR